MRARRRTAAVALLASGLSAPANALDRTAAVTQYVSETWSHDNGLTIGGIAAIGQTADGYLWVAGRSGLARFDGVRFRVYDQTNTPPLSESDDLVALLGVSDGSLWVGAYTLGLFRVDPSGAWHRVLDPSGQPDKNVLDLIEDGMGGIWAAAHGTGLVHLEGEKRTALRAADGLPTEFTNNLFLEPRGTLRVGTWKGLALLGPDGHLRRDPLSDRLPDLRITGLAEEKDGTLWVSTVAGLLRQEKDGATHVFTAQEGICPGWVNGVKVDRDGNVWAVCQEGSVARYDGRGFQTLPLLDQATARSALTTLFEDREGSLWIGSEGGTLHRLRNPRVRMVGAPEGLPGAVGGVSLDRQGRILVGGNGQVRRLEGERVTTTGLRTRSGKFTEEVVGVVDDGKSLWLSNPDSPVIWRMAADGTIDPQDLGGVAGGAPLGALAVDAAGTLWIGTMGSGLVEWGGPGTKPKVYSQDDGLPAEVVFQSVPVGPGDVWLTTHSGPAHLHGGKVEVFPELAKGGPGEVYAARDGSIWTTGHFGLARIAGGKVTTLRRAQGLCTETPGSLLEDGEGNLWMCCGSALGRIDQGELSSFFSGKAERVQTRLFDKLDGLRGGSCGPIANRGSVRTEDGRLWFATGSGLAVIDPRTLPPDPDAPPVVVESLSVDGDPLSAAAGLTLPPGAGRLEFRYASLSLTEPTRVRFRYRLAGYDRAWVDAGEKRQAEYTGLPPGSYRFEVEARSGKGPWSAAPATLAFAQAPHLWQTRTFLLTCALGLLLAGWGGYRTRVAGLKRRQEELEAVVDRQTASLKETARQLEALHREKDRLFQNISHELRTPLTLVLAPVESLLDRTDLDREARKRAETIRDNALRLLNLINDLLDLTRLEVVGLKVEAVPLPVAKVVAQIGQEAGDLATRLGLTLKVDASRAPSRWRLDPRHLEKILLNLLSNALKFTPRGGTVELSAVEDPAGLLLRVKDDGPGIPPEALSRLFERFYRAEGEGTKGRGGTGLGLALARELSRLMGGEVTVQSEVGHGATFEVRFPVSCKASPEEAEPRAGEGAVDAFRRRAAITALDPAKAPSQADQRAGLKGPVVLVVEDDPRVGGELLDILSPRYRVLLVSTAERALSTVQRELPHLIISDVMLPGMDGIELCEALRANATLKDTPIILLSARADLEDRISGRRAGADTWLSKPFHPRELQAAVEGLLRARMRLVGQYLLLARLGAGGQSEVHVAEHVETGELVAIKLLARDEALSEAGRERMRREGELLCRLHHPNVVRVLEQGTQEGRAYLVMELLSGATLRQIRTRFLRLSAGFVSEVGRGLSAALGAVHAEGVVHRDVKTGNVMVVTGSEPLRDRVRLIDFGVVFIPSSTTLTRAGALVGTTAYVAPERIKGEEPTAFSDLYSAGVVLYEIATGRLPFEGGDEAALIRAVLESRPTPPRELAPELPAGLEAVVLKAMHPDPASRFRSAGEMASALEALAIPGESVDLSWALSRESLLETVGVGRPTAAVTTLGGRR